jgi:hypothetical protein
MKRILIVAASALALGTAAQLPASPAMADTPRCVTRAEFRHVHNGMTKHRVHRIFDTRGTFGDGGAGGYSRLYRQCRKPAPGHAVCQVSVEYSDGPSQAARVSLKRWNGFCSD